MVTHPLKTKYLIHVMIKTNLSTVVIIFQDNRDEGQQDLVGSLSEIVVANYAIRAEKKPLI